ncbi:MULTISPECIES: hypothetical protein [unclassified Streptomyces]|uniref:hypothetical protein n=1 Tax=unclassified Streptomyces TaxID=2593676 RepID=UPI00190E07FA|nr:MULTISPECIES: hypothetical protein [unclassified Streptomyces]MBK3568901.1 hypothetical protein [Streptomyces sp. MBT62]MBK6014014.1 hypothetical protein [Streptomyces sp. MBT53]
MEVTVQWVRTSWTKRSRGGEAAARRNAAPVGFPLPDGMASPAHAVHMIHTVRMHEKDDFTPHDGRAERKQVAVQLREAEGRLRVFPRVDPLYGLPPRARRPPAVRLVPGQWVRWQLNYRFSSAAGVRDWSYWLDTFNVAYGPVTADVFLGTPAFHVDEQGPVR